LCEKRATFDRFIETHKDKHYLKQIQNIVACHRLYDIYSEFIDDDDEDESNNKDNDMYVKIFHINYPN
jgi:hypothetical protein